MDLVVCEAPLDNSFQKEKLVLVNKGSLGRRRKPSRANLKLLLSPSADTFPSTSAKQISQPSPINNVIKSAPTTPVYVEQKIIVNKKKENKPSRYSKIGLKIESSLPRTLPEPNEYVNDALQFTIEAKLKRRKSDSGRSAVLIQTWERRTRCDSFSRLTKPKTIARSNRFQNKENMGGATITHDSHSTYPNLNGCAKKDRWSNGGEFVASVRDGYHNGTMVHRNAVNDFNHRKVNTQPHINHRKLAEKEPEWVSLSRKLRAKFVEGHIDQDSADSYAYEEPEGVENGVPKESEVLPSVVANDQKKTTVQQPQKPDKKIRVIVDVSETSNENGEPPWIQLSRKLCTKFIEEHIEYPLVAGDVPVQVPPDILECNGDVRIIEKIGKKEKRSKSRKESEPEWISLSKKLRAKFIESHIDDPDTISLDNQLNASDPEENSSESLSDSSPEVSPVKKFPNEPKHYEPIRNDSTKTCNLNGNSEISVTCMRSKGLPFEEKECCWEYQEMEFDQESSGTFQDPESLEDNLLNNNRTDAQQFKSYNGFISQNNSAQYISDVQVCPNSMSFAETINTEPFHNAECYNNDVRFPPAYVDNSPTFSHVNYQKGSESNKKHITVQIMSRPNSKISDANTKESSPDRSPMGYLPTNNGNDFFNISTWEEAHFVTADVEYERNRNPSPQIGLIKSFKSKSMDNICDEKDEGVLEKPSAAQNKEKCKTRKIGASLVDLNSISKSETLLDQIDSRIPYENDFLNVTERNHVAAKKSSEATDHKRQKSQEAADKLQNVSSSTKNVEKSNNKPKQDKTCDEKKHFKCNGVIPNSIKVSEKNTINGKVNVNPHTFSEKVTNNACNGERIGVKSERKLNSTVCVNEYANINPLTGNNIMMINEFESTSEKLKSAHSATNNKNESPNSSNDSNCRNSYARVKKSEKNHLNPNDVNRNMNIICDKQENGVFNETSTHLKTKSKSLCDISKQKEYTSSSDESSLIQNQRKLSQNGFSPSSASNSTGFSALRFQHFASEADIPLCAKLIKQNGKLSTSSISSSSNRNASPCSESSHVYEDMFKETTSCPSDSETSSWTVMKNNSYYINGRSSSMNDLDYSDSCSMSVKCDYASSCSEHSTLQSRHSSCTSSSFYVNLRDYDSHMLEPSLKRRKEHSKKVGNGNSSKLINSNPPTPESLRHLFTSPFNSIPNRGNRLMNKLPSEPEIHYYSTAAVASTAFKHGFDPAPPKPKKTERSSSIKIKDIAHGIILTFKKFQNHSKSSHVSSTHYVDVSHLAENGTKQNGKPKKDHKDKNGKQDRKGFWGHKTDSDSGCPLSASEIQRAKARRASSDLTGMKPKFTVLNQNPLFIDDEAPSEKKKTKNGKKTSSARDKARKNRSKSVEPKAIPTVSRKVQQLADGTFYLVTTVSGDTALPGVYSDSPDTSSELSTHKPVKPTGESNC